MGPLKNPGTGPFKVDLTSGLKYICRCGQSSTYPFCDGTHDKINAAQVSVDAL